MTRKGCPACTGKAPTPNRNLLVEYPEIAAQLVEDIDPATIAPASGRRLEWKCPECQGQWRTAVGHRTRSGTGCPFCAEYGFKLGRPSYLYLVAAGNYDVIGIANVVEKGSRLSIYHKRGYSLVETWCGDSHSVRKAETELKKVLRHYEESNLPGEKTEALLQGQRHAVYKMAEQMGLEVCQ